MVVSTGQTGATAIAQNCVFAWKVCEKLAPVPLSRLGDASWACGGTQEPIVAKPKSDCTKRPPPKSRFQGRVWWSRGLLGRLVWMAEAVVVRGFADSASIEVVAPTELSRGWVVRSFADSEGNKMDARVGRKV